MAFDDIVTAIGAILVLAGIAQVFIQMFRPPPDFKPVPQGVDLKKDGLSVRSAYPGMVMIGVGALLLIVGSVTG